MEMYSSPYYRCDRCWVTVSCGLEPVEDGDVMENADKRRGDAKGKIRKSWRSIVSQGKDSLILTEPLPRLVHHESLSIRPKVHRGAFFRT